MSGGPEIVHKGCAKLCKEKMTVFRDGKEYAISGYDVKQDGKDGRGGASFSVTRGRIDDCQNEEGTCGVPGLLKSVPGLPSDATVHIMVTSFGSILHDSCCEVMHTLREST